MIKKIDFDKIQNTKRLLTTHGLMTSHVLVAVSSGVDSVVLAHHLWVVSQKLKGLELSLAYVHHGLTGIKTTDSYRNRSQKMTQKLSEQLGLPYFTNKPPKNNNKQKNGKLKKQSEEFLRKIRNDFLSQVCNDQKIHVIAKAHHSEDLLETRLIRLIRGVGPEGFTAMKVFDKDSTNFRPLLSWTKKEILEYAQRYNLKYLEDPSNNDENYLRNWIRNNWLLSLEKKRPGARSSLAKSLDQLAQNLHLDKNNGNTFDHVLVENKILKTQLLILQKSEQRRILAHYLNLLRVENYTSTQIDEILKRLDKSQKEFTFAVAGCVWTVDTRHISALRLSSSSWDLNC